MIMATLDSPISGGINKIINNFINESYLISSDKKKVFQLFHKITEHLEVLSNGIHVFTQNNDDERIATKLDRDYQNFKQKIDQLKAGIQEMTGKNITESFSS
mmetsp:Transcript_10717/g.10843  ORF Transcript_10717/g.10843 Transcript_10717/m.10843 type:complete len:102 (+) Transcript_10717:393-698(+)